jgi:hypothetical protein
VLLDAGASVHVVAERCGHDPATLLWTDAKRTKKADAAAADVIGTASAGVLEENRIAGKLDFVPARFCFDLAAKFAVINWSNYLICWQE